MAAAYVHAGGLGRDATQGGVPRGPVSSACRQAGKKRAIVALGHTILVAAYHMLKDEVDYRDLGADYFDRRQRERTTAHLVSRLHGLGYEVKREPIGNQAA